MADVDDQEELADEDAESAQLNGVAERERSGTRYPFYDLEEAEKFVKAVQESGGNEVLEDDLLRHLSLSKTTKSWVYKLSSSREFGLIDRKGQKSAATITITDLGKRLMLPGDQNELAISRAAAFLKPSLYQKLFERYKGAPVPQPPFLANLLVREHKIVESVALAAANAFINSAKHAKMVSSANVLESPKKCDARGETDETRGMGGDDGGADRSKQTVRVPDTFIAHVFQLRKDMKITVPLPPDLTHADVKRLHRWMVTLPMDEPEGSS
jgi:hypothetical protein